MILSDQDIRREIELGLLKIQPYDEGRVRPASYDTRIEGEFFDAGSAMRNGDSLGNGSVLALTPEHGTVLCWSQETITLPSDLGAMIVPRSTASRRGLHVAQGWVDPGFSGRIIFAVRNQLNRSSIMLERGASIAQLVIYRTESTARRPYGSVGLGSRYQGQGPGRW